MKIFPLINYIRSKLNIISKHIEIHNLFYKLKKLTKFGCLMKENKEHITV
jgi:hypothetical protein